MEVMGVFISKLILLFRMMKMYLIQNFRGNQCVGFRIKGINNAGLINVCS
jgi:hypothetical protein